MGWALRRVSRCAVVVVSFVLGSVTHGVAQRGLEPLAVQVWSTGEDGELDLAASSLGNGGLLPKERWRERGRLLGDGLFESRGGLRIAIVDGSVRVAPPIGTELTIDGRGRIHGDGRALTEFAQIGLVLRFHDGTELRIHAGTERAVRHVGLVEHARPELEVVLAQRGVPKQGMQRARRANGMVFYLTGNGDELSSLVAVGPMLLVRPVLVRARSKSPRLLIAGDVLRTSTAALEAATPKNRVQYPDAEKQARFLTSLCAKLFPRDKTGTKDGSLLPGVRATIAFGDDVRLDLMPFGDVHSRTLTCGLRLDPEADRTLEWVAMPGGTRMYRVLPEWQQRGHRYMGHGLEFEDALEMQLPWSMPLAHAVQRDKTLRVFAPWLPRIEAAEASTRR